MKQDPSIAEAEANQILIAAKNESPLMAALLGVMLDGGRIVISGPISEDLFNMIPEVVAFERIEISDNNILSRLTERDLVFMETGSVDTLWELNHLTAAQIVFVSSKATEPSLVDLHVQEKDLRAAVMGLGRKWDLLKSNKGQFQFFGGARRPAVFLDRDGVVIEYVEYISKPEQVVLRPGIVDFLLKAQSHGYARVIVTNQSGLGRGLFTWEDYDKVNQRILELLAKAGVVIDQVQKAPFFEDSSKAFGLVRRSLRKPRPGMFHAAKEELGLDLSRSLMVGDFATDMMAAALAGLGKVVLIKTNHTDKELKKWRDWPLLSRTAWGLELPVADSFSDIEI